MGKSLRGIGLPQIHAFALFGHGKRQHDSTCVKHTHNCRLQWILLAIKALYEQMPDNQRSVAAYRL